MTRRKKVFTKLRAAQQSSDTNHARGDTFWWLAAAHHLQ
jgi:hypothetical protein